MDSELEKRLRAAFRDKLRLLPAELHAARGKPVAAQDPATLLPSSTRVLLKRREVAEAEQELQNQRQEFQQRMQRLAQRRQQLARRQEQHRDAVLRFESFLKAAEARRERALRRAGEQRAAERARAARLQRELEQLLQRRERLAWRLRSLRPFGDYLRDVLASTGQFQDVSAMLEYLEVLVGVQAALAREAEAGQEMLTQGKAQLEQYRQESSTQLLGTRDELAQLHTRLEAARQDVLQWESCWTHIQSTAMQKDLLLGQIKLAVLNLFQQTTAQLRIPTDRSQEDTKAQLDMVLLCMQGLADICATGTHPQNHRTTRLLRGQE